MRPPVSVLALHQPALHQPSVLLSLEPLNLLSPETTLAPLNAASDKNMKRIGLRVGGTVGSKKNC